jgi:small subunit ribosomal protein S16
MSVKIRLTRTGARNAAAFRVVAADSRSPRDGRFIEILGWYDPKLESANCEVKLDRVEYWKSQGAIVSDTVKSLVKRQAPDPEAVAEEAPLEEAVVDAPEVPEAEAVAAEEPAEEDVKVTAEA